MPSLINNSKSEYTNLMSVRISDEDTIETLFCLKKVTFHSRHTEKIQNFPEYTDPGNLIYLTAMTPAKPSTNARPAYNEDYYENAGSNEYFKWKIT